MCLLASPSRTRRPCRTIAFAPKKSAPKGTDSQTPPHIRPLEQVARWSGGCHHIETALWVFFPPKKGEVCLLVICAVCG